jgi:hypothetical protein
MISKSLVGARLSTSRPDDTTDFHALEDDPIMRMVDAIYEDRIGKAKANMRDRYIAAAKETDPFLKAVKKPIVSDEELC